MVCGGPCKHLWRDVLVQEGVSNTGPEEGFIEAGYYLRSCEDGMFAND